MKKILGIVLTLFMASNVQAAPRYVDIKPLGQTVKVPVGNVKPGSQLLPIITWGGDIATIHANGNQRRTAPGSMFNRHGLDLKLVREDAFSKQVENYLSGKTPYLRGTLGMIASANEFLSKNPKTKPVVFYQMTWSAGGDALVVKPNIRKVSDLKGKTIAIQAYGPHMDYFARILGDAGLTLKDVNVKWLPDLTGTENTPMAALYESGIDAAFVIIPDALALTSGGNVGTGSEDSVKGARILMSTKTANRVISDVYAVRSDYYKTNRQEVHALAQALMEATDSLKQVVQHRSTRAKDYQSVMKASAEILLDSPKAIADTEGLYADCEFVFFDGNRQFFANPQYPRRMQKVASEVSKGLQQFGLIKSNTTIAKADINYKQLQAAIGATSTVNQSRFNKSEVSKLVTRRQQQDALADGELFSFDVFFKPNQNTFTADLYLEDFSRVVDLASAYGGAIISVEGHSDPMGYLRAKKKQQSNVVLGRIKQSARNLSLTRAQAVRDAVIQFASGNGIPMDPTQFATVGHGIAQPKSGVCGSDPCAPKTEKEWRENMRVKFRIIQVEAESDVFVPL